MTTRACASACRKYPCSGFPARNKAQVNSVPSETTPVKHAGALESADYHQDWDCIVGLWMSAQGPCSARDMTPNDPATAPLTISG
jgi:hypothetical protein